jgi:HEAT repeat protein
MRKTMSLGIGYSTSLRAAVRKHLGSTVVMALVVVACTALALAADRPQLVNGNLVDQASTGDLAKDVAAIAGPAWVGYSVPVVPGDKQICCWGSSNAFRGNANCCGGCNLEKQNSVNVNDGSSNCRLEPSSEFFVLLRVTGGHVERIRTFSADCGLNAGGMTVYWLGAMQPEQSIAFLLQFAEQRESDSKKRDESLVAIALHNSPAADTALEKLMSPGNPEHLRQQAAFWLGSARGRRGFEALKQAVRTDTDTKFLEQATFALSTSKEPEAQDELIRMARNDPRPKVREQAIFWLAQKAGQKVSKVISDSIENDPDTDVKRKAVFALSQMPDKEGVPLLIQTAQNNHNPAVRKEAMFWLGQSDDPRALDYIETVLKR